LTVREIAGMVVEISGTASELVYGPLPEDDPRRRCPDITRARDVLGWEPRVSAREGLEKTLKWFAGRQADPRAPSAGRRGGPEIISCRKVDVRFGEEDFVSK
ncbi:MAG: hypothetical protein M3R38_06065, partial [Actinomycetota bacterium]|nr:hypothetical protein [Actinomycetota bacterium]